jgi:hypothetical protein
MRTALHAAVAADQAQAWIVHSVIAATRFVRSLSDVWSITECLKHAGSVIVVARQNMNGKVHDPDQFKG